MEFIQQSNVVHLKNRRVIARNAVFTICFDDVSDEHDNQVCNYLSVIPNNLSNDISGVGILPVIGRRLALMEVYRHPLGRKSLEIPKGFVEHGETLEVAAVRELFEETGYKIEEGQLDRVCVSSSEGGVIAGSMMLFLVDLPPSESSKKDVCSELGLAKLKLIDPEEIMQLILEGDITDSVTQVLLLTYLKNKR